MRLDLVWSSFLYNSFEKRFIWGWSWFGAFPFTNPYGKASFEAEADLKHLALQILEEILHLKLDLVWFFRLQILKETLHLRMELVWSIFLYKLGRKASFEAWADLKHLALQILLKIFIWGWIWFESSCFTDPLDPWESDSFVAGAGSDHFPSQILKERLHLKLKLGLKHLASQILQERLHLRLKLVWSILPYRSFKKGFIWSWTWFEASCLTDPLRKASFEAEAGLKQFPLQMLKEKFHLRLELTWSTLL